MSKINIKINGKDIELENVSTIQEMLIARNVTGEMFVVEKNLAIIPKDKYDTKIENGDVIEIVGFFGGG
jgi:thiamine biosynthesis protein ThiS